MENLVKERAFIRKVFERLCQDLEAAFKVPKCDEKKVLAEMRQLDDKAIRLFDLDEKIKEIMFADELETSTLEEELGTVELFREKLIAIRSNFDIFFKESKNQDPTGSSNKMLKKFCLPKLELKKFDGNVRNWIGFWGQFQKIHEDPDIPCEDKFQYLLQAIEEGSPARTLIESFPPSSTNYTKAIDQLKARFARDEFLIEVYVRELLSLVLNRGLKEGTGMSLSNLYDKLETQLRALESLGVTSDKYAAMLFPLVESALPTDVLIVWERHRSTNITIKPSSNTLQLLLDFLRVEVESEERLNLAKASFGEPEHHIADLSNRNRGICKTKLQDESQLFTAAALHSSNTRGDVKKPSCCLFCDNSSHASQDCLKAQKLSLDQKRSIIMKKKGCFSCLKLNHTIRTCRSVVKCLICSSYWKGSSCFT